MAGKEVTRRAVQKQAAVAVGVRQQEAVGAQLGAQEPQLQAPARQEAQAPVARNGHTQGVYKLIDGQVHKRCRGPAHDEPVWLPATEKFFSTRKTGKRKGDLLSQCRLCQNWKRLKSPGSLRGRVPIADALPFYQEAVNRVGRQELSRRTGLSVNEGINPVLNGERKQVNKSNLRKVMLELISMRRKNEYRDTPLLRHADRMRSEKKKSKLRAKVRDIKLHDQEEHLAKIRPVKPDDRDPRWWHWTGQEWLPRYGEEMLGSDF